LSPPAPPPWRERSTAAPVALQGAPAYDEAVANRQHRLAEICRTHGVDVLYSFGSRSREVELLVRGGSEELVASSSDCDIGVKLESAEPMAVAGKVDLAQALEDLLGVQRVDLVILSEADPFLACSIIRGERLFCVDAHRADEYELYVLRRAGDLAPLERERQTLLMGSP